VSPSPDVAASKLDAPPQRSGVALAPYAGMRAGLAEGFRLDELLAQEGIPKAAWPKVDAAWKQRLAADGIDGPLFAAYQRTLAEAEDWLARRVTPLDEDLAAWMGFLAAWSQHPAPFDLLASAGLGMNDMARLERAWARRLAQDASLQRAAAELATKPPAPLPAITVAAAVRRPFPWSVGAPAHAVAAVATLPHKPRSSASPPPSLTLEQHALLCAELDIDPARSAEILARYRQTPEMKAQVDAHFRDKLAASALMRAAWHYTYQTYRDWLAARRPSSR
jgi:hypothetical protein